LSGFDFGPNPETVALTAMLLATHTTSGT